MSTKNIINVGLDVDDTAFHGAEILLIRIYRINGIWTIRRGLIANQD